MAKKNCPRSGLLESVFCHGFPGVKNTSIPASVRVGGKAAKTCAQLGCFGGKVTLVTFSTVSYPLFRLEQGISAWQKKICPRSGLLESVFCHGFPGVKNTSIPASVRVGGKAAKTCAQLGCFGGKVTLVTFSTVSYPLFRLEQGIFFSFIRKHAA